MELAAAPWMSPARRSQQQALLREVIDCVRDCIRIDWCVGPASAAVRSLPPVVASFISANGQMIAAIVEAQPRVPPAN
jgi:hypothetical protein